MIALGPVAEVSQTLLHVAFDDPEEPFRSDALKSGDTNLPASASASNKQVETMPTAWTVAGN